ncbi:MAG: TIGR04551 family protein [Deltaproteobacteria bacterium]|nr:TIGR04551 family protein [Deltaproteobacteria bacterium]
MTRLLRFALALPFLLGSLGEAFAQSPALAPSLPASGTLSQTEIDQRIQEAVQKEVAKVKEQLRDEVRAEIQGAQSASEFLGEQTEKKKLNFLELNGYFRFRWDLFNKLNGGLPADPMGWYLWNGNTDISATPPDGTQTGGNMRLRVDPTFNVSEQVRIRAQIDFLDNVVLGSTPIGRNYNQYEIFSGSQTSPVAGVNWFSSAVSVKRAWGEVQTPVGLLSFGRMPANWGSGIYYNNGDGIDQDFGDNVDRIQFAIPLGQFLGGLAVTPYYEWAGSGITYAGTFNTAGIGQPVNWTQDDDAGAIGLMAARQDTPDQERRKLEKGGSSVSYGLLFNYKSQRFGLPALSLQSPVGIVPPGVGSPVGIVKRDASAGTVDLFFRWMNKKFEIEAEVVGIWGSIGNINWDPAAAAVAANIRQGAGVLRGKAKLGDGGRFAVGGEFGIASGDEAPGFGNFPGRCNLSLPAGDPLRCNQMALGGSIDGQQYSATAAADPSPTISNYRFNPAYQVDLILWRRLLGTVTDAWYLKPTFRWDVLDGLNVAAQIVYSQAIFATSTPSQVNRPLGIELDVGVKYQSDDGFVFFLDYGLLKLLSGFNMTTTVSSVTSTVTPSGLAQNIHAGLGIVF